MEDSESLKYEAAWRQLCLDYGVMTRAEVIAWADLHIESQDHPDASMTDIALATEVGTQDMLRLLDAVPGSVDRDSIRRRFFRELATRLRAEPGLASATARILYRMAMSRDVPSEAAFAEMCCFDDELEMVEYAGRNIAEVRDRLLEFLETHG